MSTLGEKAAGWIGTAAVAVGTMSPGPELTATDVYTDKTMDAATTQACDVDAPAPSYYDDKPVEGIERAIGQMGQALGESLQTREQMTGDLDGVPGAEAADHDDPPAGSTLAADEATDPFCDEAVDADSAEDATHVAAEADAFSDDAVDANTGEEAADATEGDAFSDEAVDADLGDDAGAEAGDADAGDADGGDGDGDGGS
ncbi:hypothetical protein [Blastococcus sp. SYSU D01042]